MRSAEEKRQERLAAALRENLRKRKAQARMLVDRDPDSAEAGRDE